MGIMRIMKTDDTHFDEECADTYQGQPEMRTRLQEIVDGDVEIVWVLYKGRRTGMIVNDRGATVQNLLPVNKPASEIYHNATALREGMSASEAFEKLPKIHGDAVLLFDCNAT